MRLGPDYRSLWQASAVSNIGDGIYLGALPLLAAALTRQPLEIALVSAASWLPWLVVGVVGGAVADRSDRVRIMIVADGFRCGALLVLVVAMALGAASITVLIVVALALGVAQTFFDSAAQAVIPVVVGRDSARLARANGQLAAAQTMGKELVGPPIGASVFVLAPFVLDAVSFLASAVRLLRLRGRFPAANAAVATPTSVGADIIVGARWLASNRVVLVMAVVVGLSNLAWVGSEAVLVLLAQDRLGVSGPWFGVLLAAPGVGAIPGSMLAGMIGRRVPLGGVFVGGLIAQAGVLFVVGSTTSVFVVLGMSALGGALIAVWNVNQAVQRQLLVPDRLMGRVVASMRVIAYGAAPLGAVLGGLVAAAFGPSATFRAGAAVLVVAAAIAMPCLNARALARARESAAAAN